MKKVVEKIKQIYPTTLWKKQINRYLNLQINFKNIFPQNSYHIFRVGGRIELLGNHTDHNNGLVIASTVYPDMIAAAVKNDKRKIVIYSEKFDLFYSILLDKDIRMEDNEKNKTIALIKGILNEFVKNGYEVGGFNAYISSDIPVGSGLSSSAAFEILICGILNNLFNNNKIDNLTMAEISQKAESEYFGKACGLMDQIAVSYGGTNLIDFYDFHNPKITNLPINFDNLDSGIYLLNTFSSHLDKTLDYSQIQQDMKNVAKILGKSTARDLAFEKVIENNKKIREQLGERAILRVFHYLDENERVKKFLSSSHNIKDLFNLIKESGNSSFKWLQNIYSVKDITNQPLALSLYIAEKYLQKSGAFRVHGGGFGGTILLMMPLDKVENFTKTAEKFFGKNCILKISFTDKGFVKIV